jgi:hypothetical protein
MLRAIRTSRNLARLAKVIDLAEELGLHLEITGLGNTA